MNFGVIDFLQKTNERIRLYYYDTSGRLVFVRFLEGIEDTKKTFRNYLTFIRDENVVVSLSIFKNLCVYDKANMNVSSDQEQRAAYCNTEFIL